MSAPDAGRAEIEQDRLDGMYEVVDAARALVCFLMDDEAEGSMWDLESQLEEAVIALDALGR